MSPEALPTEQRLKTRWKRPPLSKVLGMGITETSQPLAAAHREATV